MARVIIPVDRSAALESRLVHPDEIVLRFDDVRVLTGPIVYVWTDGRGQALYVGMSRHGLLRCFSREHPLRGMRDHDRLRVLMMPSVDEALRREGQLIRELHPRLNKRGKTPPTASLDPR